MQLVDDELDAFLTGKTPGHQPEKPENGNIYIRGLWRNALSYHKAILRSPL